MIDKEKLKRRFSRNARQYDQYASVQKQMASELIKMVQADGRDYHRILEIGCGTGYLTALLTEAYPRASITAVDIAEGMLSYAASRLEGKPVIFLCEDAESMTFNSTYDLIISNATFQWFNHLEQTLAKLTAHLSEQGRLSFSTFGSETFQELHQAFGAARSEMGIQTQVAPGQAFYTLETLTAICEGTGTEGFEREYFDACVEFLASVKKIGANKSQSESETIVIPGLIDRAMAIYDTSYRDDTLGKVYATYHCLYMHIIR